MGNTFKPVIVHRDAVIWTVTPYADPTPVRGNVIVTGDDAEDKKVEDQVLWRLRNGDVWAWCTVEVKGYWRGLAANAFIGCCSCKDEIDFCASGYYEDLQSEIVEALQAQVDRMLQD